MTNNRKGGGYGDMKILYKCEICGEVYDKRADAKGCEAQGEEHPIVAVGDFVTTDAKGYGRFSWYDGDSDWVIPKTRGEHGPAKRYSLIYVITAITHVDPFQKKGAHRVCYHLVTKGMSGLKGYTRGYTFNRDHVGIHKIEADLDGSDLIGLLAPTLV